MKKMRVGTQKELFWRRTLGRFATSGITKKEFCRREGLTESSFSWWKSNLGRRDRDRDAENGSVPTVTGTFVPVAIADPSVTPLLNDRNGLIEIDLRQGIVRISGAPTAHTLTALLAVLREPAP